ncbi:hypothetical protein [Streptomyces venezuelae]|uniref:hypothetical protein n=1 Tax=Streptomyces venezuelae TaxID=54571 RepID=UPI0012386830|nr:hypothetical protein [Streptomyces venezuelae]
MASVALLVTLTPAIADDGPAVDPVKKARLASLLKAISVTGSNLDEENEAVVKRHYNLLDALQKEFPEQAKEVSDPRQMQVLTEEAVITEDGQAVSPVTGKPLSAAELAAIEPPAGAQESNPAEEQETPEETEVDPDALAASRAKEPASGAGMSAARVSGGRWKMTHITYTHRSYFHNVIFKYHTYARFNYKGGKVRAWGQRYDDFSHEQSGVDTDLMVTNVKSKVPASSATSKMKRKVYLKVPVYGEYATVYPWAKVKVYGTGRTKIAGSGA